MRLNATAPTWPSLRDNASARITTATGFGLLASGNAVIGGDEGQGDKVGNFSHDSIVPIRAIWRKRTAHVAGRNRRRASSRFCDSRNLFATGVMDSRDSHGRGTGLF